MILVMATQLILLVSCICILTLQWTALTSTAPAAKNLRKRRQLPCDHPIRYDLPQYFTHCETAPSTYSDWSTWERISGSLSSTPTSQCPSGQAYTEQHTRLSTGSGCTEPLIETQRICKLICMVAQ